MTIKIGTNPIAWSNDDMQELGAQTSLETCLSQAHAAGFRGIELGHKFPRQADVLRPILSAHSIELVGGWYSTELLTRNADEEIIAMQNHLRLLKDMGCEVFILAETSNAIHGARDTELSQSPVLDDEQWITFTQRMNDICAYLRSQGLKPAYHHHMGTAVETEEEIDRFMSLTSNEVGLLMDAGHATFAGVDPVQITQRYAQRITHVHCKDIRLNIREQARAERLSFLDAVVEGVFTVPGDGDVNFPAILQQLKAANYCGWLVVEAEQDPARADPLTYARLGYNNLSKMAAEAGLEQE